MLAHHVFLCFSILKYYLKILFLLLIKSELTMKKLLLVAFLLYFFSTVNGLYDKALFVPETGEGTLEEQNKVTLLDLNSFQNQIDNSQFHAGLYAPRLFSYPIVSQPPGDTGFVSSQPGVLTDFALAKHYGSTGLLAHNTLAGKSFSLLKPGDSLAYYEKGKLQWYRVEKVLEYQALNPNSPTSNFRDLEHPEQIVSASELFLSIYVQPGKLILQTCIARNQNESWGRLFVIATPVSSSEVSSGSLQEYTAAPLFLVESLASPR